MQNQINLSPVTQLIQQIRSAELNSDKEIRIPIAKARLLMLTLAECMDKLNQDYETMFNQLKQSVSNETITVELDGGGFDSSK